MEQEKTQEFRAMSLKQGVFMMDLWKTKTLSDAEKETLWKYLAFNKFEMKAASKVIKVLRVNALGILSVTVVNDEEEFDVDVPALQENA